MSETRTRISYDLDPKQLTDLKTVCTHMGKKLGGKLSVAQVLRALVAGYMKRERLEKNEDSDV